MLQTAAQTGRKVALFYNSFSVGRGLVQWAREHLLGPADTLYIAHVFSSQNVVGWLVLASRTVQ